MSEKLKLPSDYEQKEIISIHQWKNPKLTWFDKAMEIANWPIDKAGDLVMETPGVGWVIEKSATGLVGALNDFAQWSVRPDAIFEEFRDCGHSGVTKHKEVSGLDLEAVDKVIGFLGAKYKSLALTEGALTGTAGLPGIPADVVALILMNLRAIGEYATYCGFDMASQQERLFALNILGLASSPTDASKTVAMTQLVKIAKDVALNRPWKQLEKHAFVQIIQKIAESLGIRLTKAKLAQIVPVSGAVVGGGFNAYFTAKVCDAAYYLYRERFLATKYGPDIIDETVGATSGFGSDDAEEAASFSAV